MIIFTSITLNHPPPLLLTVLLPNYSLYHSHDFLLPPSLPHPLPQCVCAGEGRWIVDIVPMCPPLQWPCRILDLLQRVNIKVI